MKESESALSEFARRASRIKGVLVSPSMFKNADAYWVNGKEIPHDEVTGLDLRLTRAVIKANRDRLKQHPGVIFRRSGGDWIQIQISTQQDVAFALEMFKLAVKAHLPEPGVAMKTPPTGADLQRRRRFH